MTGKRWMALCTLLLAGMAIGFNLEPRIVGGNVVSYDNDTNAPRYMVAVLPGDFFCGGSYIGERMVVTAAHCTDDFSAEEIEVAFSEDGRLVVGSIIFVEVEEVINHPSYNDTVTPFFDNDIAILVLKNDPPEYVTSVRFISEENSVALEAVRAITRAFGWGNTSYDGSSSNSLRRVDVYLDRYSECVTMWGAQVSTNMICAGSRDMGKDTCQGDSGGPLTYLNSGQPVLVGITSFGNRCASYGWPSVYARASSYIEWINQHRVEAIIPIDIEIPEMTAATIMIDSVVPIRTGNGSFSFGLIALLLGGLLLRRRR